MSETDIKAFLRDKYGDRAEKYLEAGSLLIFWGPKQKTWLIATNKALYCVFDISKENIPRVKWRIDSDYIKNGLPISVQDYSDHTGYVVIDSKNRRKYSRKLFTQVSISNAIRAMLHASLGSPTTVAA